MGFKELFGFKPSGQEKKDKPERIEDLAKRIRIVDPEGRAVDHKPREAAEGCQTVKTRTRREAENEAGISRRGFLKGAAILTGAAVVGGGAFKAAEYLIDKAKEEAEEETPEQAEITEEDIRSVKDIFNYRKEGRIEFNLKTVERIKEHWKRQYQENPELKESFIRGFKAMGQWRPYLEKIFTEQGLPEEYMYLAIPESHWRMHARSRMGAKGPYQFMPDTAKKFDLKMTKNVDERCDPLKSGQACAKLLKQIYRSSGDKSLTFSGYNGGFLWQYLRQEKEQGNKPEYKGFLTFMEDKINQTRDKIKTSRYLHYNFKAKDSLFKLAEKYQVSVEELMKLSGITDERKIRPGQRIVIPGGEAQKQIYFQDKIAGFAENLNYPAKFYAVLELIKEGFVTEQAKPITFQTRTVKQGQVKVYEYRVKPGDTLYNIGRRFHTDLKRLHRDNRDTLKHGLKAGSTLIIKGHQPEVITLASLARKVKRPVSRLIYLNPAININAPILDGYEIRV